MENNHDELMDDLELPKIYTVFFQFDNGEPIKLAYTAGEDFSLTLKATHTEEPSVIFSDGIKEFKLFMKIENE